MIYTRSIQIMACSTNTDSMHSHQLPLKYKSYKYQGFKIFIIFTSTNTTDRLISFLLFDFLISPKVLQL